VGAIPEYFRLRAGTLRSLHPTHSVCGVGAGVEELFREHPLDHTPCGPHSPFHCMIDLGAKIVMLGCGLRPNTTMHALEEYIVPPYLFSGEREYTIIDSQGFSFLKTYTKHGFRGWQQRYDRVAELPDPSFLSKGKVLEAETYVLDAHRLKAAVLKQMRQDPLFFVDKENIQT
jgi:aminoglycoside 3-N-acetyltransferase